MEMRFRQLILVALALATVPAMAQTSTRASSTDVLKTSECAELDEDEARAFEALDDQSNFFDRLNYDCDADWLDAEQRVGPQFRHLGQESFAQYSRLEGDDNFAFRRLRRVSFYGGDDYHLVRIDCKFSKERDSYGLTTLKPEQGKVRVEFHNVYHTPKVSKRELRLGSADCGFISEWIDEYSPDDLEARLETDPEGDIVLHGGVIFFESLDSDGAYNFTERLGSWEYLPNKESDRVEKRIIQLMSYFENRANEGGRKISQ